MSELAGFDGTSRWLVLCGLERPDAEIHLVEAACADLQRCAELPPMLRATPEAFRRWWYEQDHQPWRMTAATGSTDWAWLLLARLGFEVQQSQFSELS